MSRQPSVETQLRTARSELRASKAAHNDTKDQRDAWMLRAQKAEAESAEWKQRFDALFAKHTKDGGK